MSIQDIIIKILLFFAIFYGAIMLTSLISKKIRNLNEEKKDKDKKEQ